MNALVPERGDKLARLAARLERLRAEGLACQRCPRLLAAGASCPDHGRPRPWGLRRPERKATP